jgi:dihydroorotate dehydrogenase
MITGGMSWKGLYPQSLATVKALSKETNLPLIGVGGIGYEPDGKDLLEMEKAGANICQILSAVVQWPHGLFTPYYLNQALLWK